MSPSALSDVDAGPRPTRMPSASPPAYPEACPLTEPDLVRRGGTGATPGWTSCAAGYGTGDAGRRNRWWVWC